MGAPSQSQGKAIGRYVLYDEIAAGGMATVHLGRLMGAAGFSRLAPIGMGKKIVAAERVSPDMWR